MSGGLVLNLGCGNTHLAGAVNVDVSPGSRADILHDLTIFPWPFPDDHFAAVRAHDIIEHLPDTVRTMEELHRICRPGAVLDIAVPHFSGANAYLDPTHVRYFGARTFDMFAAGSTLYTAATFNVRRRQIVFAPTLLNRVVARLANRNVARYEERFAWVFPAWFISLELEVIKS